MEETTNEIVLSTDPELLQKVKEELQKQETKDSRQPKKPDRLDKVIVSSRKIIIALLHILLTEGKIVFGRDQKRIYDSLKENYSDDAFEGACIQIERLCKVGKMRM